MERKKNEMNISLEKMFLENQRTVLIREFNVTGYKLNIQIDDNQLENEKYLFYSKFYKVPKVLLKDIKLDMNKKDVL